MFSNGDNSIASGIFFEKIGAKQGLFLLQTDTVSKNTVKWRCISTGKVECSHQSSRQDGMLVENVNIANTVPSGMECENRVKLVKMTLVDRYTGNAVHPKNRQERIAPFWPVLICF